MAMKNLDYQQYDHTRSFLWNLEILGETIAFNSMEKVVPEFVCDRSETIESNLQKLVEFLSNAPEFAEGEAIVFKTFDHADLADFAGTDVTANLLLLSGQYAEIIRVAEDEFEVDYWIDDVGWLSATFPKGCFGLIEERAEKWRDVQTCKRKADDFGEERQAKKVKFTTQDGDQYLGEVNKSGEAHGYGEAILSKGHACESYKGQWENNKFHGQGRLIWKD
eukprot:6967180-Pyramimonas_sp.AAC.1